jgi:hypothetical protein
MLRSARMLEGFEFALSVQLETNSRGLDRINEQSFHVENHLRFS